MPRELHLQQLRDFLKDKTLTDEEWRGLGLQPTPARKAAAKQLALTPASSRFSCPEAETGHKTIRSMVVPLVKVPETISVSWESDTHIVKRKPAALGVNPNKESIPPPPPNSNDSTEVMEPP